MAKGQVHIRNFTLKELESWVEYKGEKRFRARQIFRHLHGRYIDSWESCTDLSVSLRDRLWHSTILNALSLQNHMISNDETERFVFTLRDTDSMKLGIETVLIPDPPRYTLCISTQVGCPLRCVFCYTGSVGFRRNLTAGEIVEQVSAVQRYKGSCHHITNIVFMGMGEPLLNEKEVFRAIEVLLDPNGFSFSHRRITVSTVGIVPIMEKLGKNFPVNLAVSLHAPTDDIRSKIMPVNHVYPLSQVIQACKEYPLPPRKRITFEYVLIEGVNDSASDARHLVRTLKGIRCKVNLIPYNPFPESSFKRPDDQSIEAFQKILLDAQITTTIRQSRGEDIGAACGQLGGEVYNYGNTQLC